MAVDWKGQAIEQFDWYWQTQFRPRLDGLTDDEYFWEPVPGCWSIRPRGESSAPVTVGVGEFLMDYEMPEPDPPPLTTIAWRMAHIAVGVFGMRASNHFGDGALEYRTADYPGTAADGIAYLEDSYATWLAGVSKLDDDGLAKPVGPAEGPFADRPYAELVLHLNREAIHHGAEIALLRDLYRARSDR